MGSASRTSTGGANVGTITSSLNSSGVVTSTQTLSFTDRQLEGDQPPVTGTMTGNYVLQLGNGNDATWTGQWTYYAGGPDTGCLFAETITFNISGSEPVTLQPYTPQASLTLVDPENAGYILPLPSSVDPNSVPSAQGIGGIAADGASAAAIVYHSFSRAPVTFTLTGLSTYSGDALGGSIGGLTSFDPNYPSNPQTGSTGPLQVSTPLDTTTCNSTTDTARTSNCTFLALL